MKFLGKVRPSASILSLKFALSELKKKRFFSHQFSLCVSAYRYTKKKLKIVSKRKIFTSQAKLLSRRKIVDFSPFRVEAPCLLPKKKNLKKKTFCRAKGNFGEIAKKLSTFSLSLSQPPNKVWTVSEPRTDDFNSHRFSTGWPKSFEPSLSRRHHIVAVTSNSDGIFSSSSAICRAEKSGEKKKKYFKHFRFSFYDFSIGNFGQKMSVTWLRLLLVKLWSEKSRNFPFAERPPKPTSFKCTVPSRRENVEKF